jgi:hypothetical protein
MVIMLLDEKKKDKDAGGTVAKSATAPHDDLRMRFRALVFALFAAAMLFSMVREWSAPVGCPRLQMTRTRDHPQRAQ